MRVDFMGMSRLLSSSFNYRLRELAKYVVLNLLLWRVTIALHEDGHWITASLLGYRDIIVVFSFAGGYALVREPIASPLHGLLIGLGGGLWVSVVYSAFYMVLDWETDMAEKMLLKTYVLSQFTYAVVEGIYGLGLLDIGVLSLISMIVYPICLYGYLIWLFIYLYVGE